MSDLALSRRWSQDRTEGGAKALIPALALLTVSVLATCLAGLWPGGVRGQYAVIAPPWYDLSHTLQLVSTAGGAVMDVGGWSNVVVVHADNPNAIWALYAAGAWLVLDPVRLRGCLGLGASATAGGT